MYTSRYPHARKADVNNNYTKFHAYITKYKVEILFIHPWEIFENRRVIKEPQ